MGVLDSLIACAGRWVGTNRLEDLHANMKDRSASSVTVTPILGNRFVRLEYTWTYRDAPQEGVFLVGHDVRAGELTLHWIDTFHMSDKVMASRGKAESTEVFSVRGSYAAPPGPDWGWRTDILPEEQHLRIHMYNVTPEGQEELAVEAQYTRESPSQDIDQEGDRR